MEPSKDAYYLALRKTQKTIRTAAPDAAAGTELTELKSREIRDNGSRASDVAQAAPALLQLAGIVWTKPLAPLPNRFIGIYDSSLSHKIFDVTETKAAPMIQPDRVADEF